MKKQRKKREAEGRWKNSSSRFILIFTLTPKHEKIQSMQIVCLLVANTTPICCKLAPLYSRHFLSNSPWLLLGTNYLVGHLSSCLFSYTHLKPLGTTAIHFLPDQFNVLFTRSSNSCWLKSIGILELIPWMICNRCCNDGISKTVSNPQAGNRELTLSSGNGI